MMPETRDLLTLPVREAEAFTRAGIKLLPKARAVLAANRTRAIVIPGGTGMARLINLAHWQVDHHLEYLDEAAVNADQLIHFAAHQVMACVLGCEDAHALLLAETFASALDLFLLGKLIGAGEETEFLVETVESFGAYCDLYGKGPVQLEALLTRIRDDPFASMAAAADYLYRVAEILLTSQVVAETAAGLAALASDPLYPLIHHYNVVNWVLAIRVRYPTIGEPPYHLARARKLFWTDEASFLQHFRPPE